MKILRARFENFRLLRNLELDFSVSSERRLTVIRAENESGKTTILNGLQWGLYGDDALPEKGRGYRLHPIDWNAADGKPVPISVEIDFETAVPQRIGAEHIERYRIIRSVHETLEGQQWSRGASTTRLFHLGDSGGEPVDYPEAQIKEELPLELREVFFTDGDRALSFIEAATNTKRDRVQKAIRSLLGLDAIEEALRHVNRAGSEVNKRAKESAADETVSEVASRLEGIGDQFADLEKNISDAQEQSLAFEGRIIDLQKSIDDALVKGNKEQLIADRNQTQLQLQQIDKELADANRDHSLLLRGLPLARDLLAPVLEESLRRLDELREQGKIPNSTIPVLEERLQVTVCICGESLKEDEVESLHRREHIRGIIEESRKATELQSTLTDLHFGSGIFQPRQAGGLDGWTGHYQKVSGRRENLQTLRDQHARKLRSLEVQVDQIPDTDIQGLRDTQRSYRVQRERFNDDRVRYETQRDSLREQEVNLTRRRDQLLKQQKEGTRILAELNVAQDLTNILGNAYEQITTEELSKVSTLMNDLFLEMIGADPEQGAIIQRARIDEDFDIVVFGPNNRMLNPDRDLNGASRRALTLAFILALTKVSEVDAPNVIDTPLGMMSGYVKRSVLKTAIRESSQLILFLTRAEIKDCEEILDEEAGVVITLTNPAHYPLILSNDPEVNGRTILRCGCSHRQECERCHRRIDSSIPAQLVTE